MYPSAALGCAGRSQFLLWVHKALAWVLGRDIFWVMHPELSVERERHFLQCSGKGFSICQRKIPWCNTRGSRLKLRSKQDAFTMVYTQNLFSFQKRRTCWCTRWCLPSTVHAMCRQCRRKQPQSSTTKQRFHPFCGADRISCFMYRYTYFCFLPR